jgi:hypothetical protein
MEATSGTDDISGSEYEEDEEGEGGEDDDE